MPSTVPGLNDLQATHGEVVVAPLIERAVTARELTYADGATQLFAPDGRTTYVDRGRVTHGEWYVDDDGHFTSFWPPTYRARYLLRWIVENGLIVGLRFIELAAGTQFDGRYQA